MVTATFHRIVAHYERCLERHGDTHRGVDWPKAEDADARYAVMLGVVRPDARRPVRLLDFGCGAGHLLDFIRRRGITGLEYVGLDLSERFVALCRTKFPGVPFHCLDVLADPDGLPAFDYAVLNGVFTERCDVPADEMWAYTKAVVRTVFARATGGIAFNVMSKEVDWERADLFHLPFDDLAAFLAAEVSRHFVFRHEYGLYEYTAYVYREPVAWPA